MSTQKKSWYKKRGYLHFDQPVGYRKALALASSPSKVSKHSFWPFINYEAVSDKLGKDDLGNLKNKKKYRPIAYAAHLDSHIYSYYTEKLSKLYEIELDRRSISKHILAFRSLGKSNIEFAKDAFDTIQDFGVCEVVAIDISGFFDNLDHTTLKKSWCNLLGKEKLPKDHFSIYKSLTNFSSVSRNRLYKEFEISIHNPASTAGRICSPEEFRIKIRAQGLVSTNNDSFGIPQGSPISALLSNIYMLDFDQEIAEEVDSFDGFYFRYCDDMLFIGPANQGFSEHIERLASQKLNDSGLTLNADKTEIRNFNEAKSGIISDKPLQYLGFLFDGQKILIRSSAFARFSERMKKGVKTAKRTMKKRNKSRARKGLTPSPLYKQKIYERYSHLGKRNFIRYGHRAALIMNSKSIKKQLKPLWTNLQNKLEE